MNAQATLLAEEARRLPPADRIETVVRILSSLSEPDSEFDKAWADKAERRLNEYSAGGAAGRDAEAVLAKYLKP